jgi:hypothetical protein
MKVAPDSAEPYGGTGRQAIGFAAAMNSVGVRQRKPAASPHAVSTPARAADAKLRWVQAAGTQC